MGNVPVQIEERPPPKAPRPSPEARALRERALVLATDLAKVGQLSVNDITARAADFAEFVEGSEEPS